MTMELMLGFVMVDWVGRRGAASSQPWPGSSPIAVPPARSYAHCSHLLFWHELAPRFVRGRGGGLKCPSGSFHQREWALAEQLSQLASGGLSPHVYGSPHCVFQVCSGTCSLRPQACPQRFHTKFLQGCPVMIHVPLETWLGPREEYSKRGCTFLPGTAGTCPL